MAEELEKKAGDSADKQIPKQFEGFPDKGTEDYYDASLRPESKPSLNEFDDDFYDGYFNVTR